MKTTIIKRIDWTLLAAFLCVLLIGLAVLYSATHKMNFSSLTQNYVIKQMVWACLGILLIMIMNLIIEIQSLKNG